MQIVKVYLTLLMLMMKVYLTLLMKISAS